MQIQSPFLKPDLIDEEYTSTGPSFPLHAFSPGVCPIGSLFSPNASDFSDPGLGVRPQGRSLALMGVIPWVGMLVELH